MCSLYQTMMEQLDKYTLNVKKAILSAKDENFSDVSNLHCISSTFFEREKYPALFNLIKAGRIENLPTEMGNTVNKVREYLYVYSFVDQDQKRWLATIYDSDELWQDLELFDIIPSQ